MPILTTSVLLFLNFIFYVSSCFGASLHENVSVTLQLSGDLTGQYDFSGPLNQTIKAESDPPGSACEAAFLFRKVKQQGQLAVEAWPSFECTRDGQKKSYKLHRSFLDPGKERQKIAIKALDQKVRNLTLEFRDLTLQKGK